MHVPDGHDIINQKNVLGCGPFEDKTSFDFLLHIIFIDDLKLVADLKNMFCYCDKIANAL